MAKQTLSSRTQDRVAGLLGLDHDGTYSHAARVLDAAGIPADGMVNGLDHRAIKKLSDADLLVLLPAATPVVDVKTTAQVAADADQARRDAKAVRKQRAKTNDRLRAHGFRWTKTAQHADNIDPRDLNTLDTDDPMSLPGWVLVDPSGDVTTVDAALATIR